MRMEVLFLRSMLFFSLLYFRLIIGNFRDLKSYQDLISTFNCPQLPERFEFISQLGKVFLIEPQILKSYIAESALARIDLHLLRPYLAQRSDWTTIEKAFDGQGVAPAPGASLSDAFSTGSVVEAKGLRDRLGMSRLSTMMHELEGLRSSGTMGANLGSGFSFAHRLGVS